MKRELDRLRAAVEAVRQECHALEWNLEDTADSAARHILNTLEAALKDDS